MLLSRLLFRSLLPSRVLAIDEKFDRRVIVLLQFLLYGFVEGVDIKSIKYDFCNDRFSKKITLQVDL